MRNSLSRVLPVALLGGLVAAPMLAQEPQGKIQVSAEMASAKLIHKVTPRYTPLAFRAKLEGVVRLRVFIGKDGKVTEVEVIEGHPLLAKAAIDAVLQWRYAPTLVDDQPVEVQMTLDITFRLHDPAVLPSRRQVEAASVFRGNEYSNFLLGFSYTFPKGFNGLSGEEARKFMALGDVSEPEYSYRLLLSFRPPVDDWGSTPVISVFGWELGARPKASPLENLHRSLAALERQGWKFSGRPKRVRYGGREFWQAQGTLFRTVENRKETMWTAVLMTEAQGYPLAWLFTAWKQQELKSLLNTAKSIRFSE